MVVSSPRHLRCVQIIAGQLFADGDGYKIGLQPVSLKIFSLLDCLQLGPCRDHVASEYLKIAWFLVYGWFV